MRIPFLPQRFGRDLIYLSIIVGLVGWFWLDASREKARQKAWNTILYSDMKAIEELGQRHSETTLKEVIKFTEAYSCKLNDLYAYRVKAIKSGVDSLKIALKGAIALSNEKKGGNHIDQATFEKIKQSANTLCDSMYRYVEYYPETTTKIKKQLSHETWNKFWEIMKTAPNAQDQIILEDLSWRVELAHAAFLERYSKWIEGSGTPFDKYTPASSPEKLVVRPGELFETDIFLSSYSSSKHISSIQVNGKSIPVNRGIATFSKRYFTPGKKKYDVRIEVTNPLTESVEVFSKTFGLLVVDSYR